MDTHISGICEDCDNLQCTIIGMEHNWELIPEILMCADYRPYNKVNDENVLFGTFGGKKND